MNTENFENRQEQDNLKYESLEDIELQEVKEDDPDFGSALEINVPEDSKTDIEAEVRNKLKTENWWLQEEWQEKGAPGEQIDIQTGKHKIILYNFGEPLQEQHLEELKRALEDISKVSNKLLTTIKYILINNVSKFNPQSGENFRGYSEGEMSAIQVYPEGRELMPYGRIEGVSNFDAIIIHECSHNIRKIDLDFVNKWRENFWVFIEDFDKKRKMSGSDEYRLDYDPINPDRCVSEYAKSSPDEDICESIVAALRAPAVLDPKKLQFIKSGLLKEEKPSEKIVLQKRDKIELPKKGSPVKYKVKKFQFKWEEK